jgi:hypothetical protein
MSTKFDLLCETSMRNLARSTLAAAMIGSTTPMASNSAHGSSTRATSIPRGIRNNNPGNIVKSPDKWEGSIGDDGRFLIFVSMEWGIRAMAKNIRTQQSKHKINTLRQLITRLSPPNENDTKKYIAVVHKWTGIDPDKPLNLSDPNTLSLIIDALIRYENGHTIDMHTIKKGIGIIDKTYKK